MTVTITPEEFAAGFAQAMAETREREKILLAEQKLTKRVTDLEAKNQELMERFWKVSLAVRDSPHDYMALRLAVRLALRTPYAIERDRRIEAGEPD